MKKLISIFLALTLLLTTFSGLGLSVYAGERTDKGTLVPDEETWVSIAEGEVHSYYFTPEIDGYYTLDSYNDEYGNQDTYVTLYEYADEAWEEISSDDDGGNNGYFNLAYSLEAGVQYRYDVKMYGDEESGSFYIRLTYFDTSNITGITAESTVTELVVNTGGNEEYDYTDGQEVQWYHYSTFRILNNCTVTIHYNDETTKEVSYYNLTGNKSDRDNQYSEHWELGGTYEIEITYFDFTTTIPVTIVENPIKSVEFKYADGVPELIEDADSHRNDVEFDYYEWRGYVYDDGNQIILTDKNNVETVYTYEDGAFTDGNGNFINEDDISFRDTQEENHWYPGNEYQATLKVYGVSTTFTVARIVENPVKSISFHYAAYPEGVTLVEGTSSGYWEEDGYYDEDDIYHGNTYYHYNFGIYLYEDGNQLTVNYTDGSSVTYTYEYNEDADEYGYFSADGSVLDGKIYASEWQPEGYARDRNNQPWSVGSDNNYCYISYMGREYRYPVTVIENPVKEISYNAVKTTSFVQEGYGNYDTDDNGDSYFHYYYDNSNIKNNSIKNEGDTVTLTYTDGSTEVFTYSSMEKVDSDGESYKDWGFYNSDGVDIDDLFVDCYLRIYDNQESEHWSVGSNNYSTVSFAGAEDKIPVTITESPVKSISLTLKEDIVLFENYTHHGWYRTDENTGERYFYYDAYSINYTDGIGNTLKVNYKDGTSKTYVYDGHYFIDSDGKPLEYDYHTKNYQKKEHWSVGDNYYDFSYLGASTPVKVTVTQSPVESVSFTPVSDIRLIEGEDGWTEDGCFYYEDYGFRDGDRLTVNYKNGTSEVYTYKDYDFYDAEGNRLYYWVDVDSEQSGDNPWKVGEEHSFTLTYIDAETEIPVSIIENPVASISFNPSRSNVYYGTDKADYRSGNIFADGDKLTVTNKDGSKDVLTYSVEKYTFVDENGIRVNDDYTSWGISEDGKTFTIEYLGASTTVPVTFINADAFTDFTYTPSHEVTIDPDDYLYYDTKSDGTRHNYYKAGFPFDGDVITLTTAGGDKVSYTCRNGRFFDKDGNILANTVFERSAIDGMGGGGDEFTGADFYYSEEISFKSYDAQAREPWTAGNTYKLPVTFCNLFTTVDVTISEAHEHKAGKLSRENYVPATVKAEGSYDMVTRCTVCGKELSREHFTIPKLPTGWVKDNNGEWTYYSADGTPATGWQKINKVWYYFDDESIMQTGWQKIGGAWYYFASGGAMQTGWQKLSKVWYYFAASGAMQTGWQKIGGTWYYFASGGAMQTGWQKIGSAWYYFTSGGAMQTGWQKIANRWYYFASGGAMQTGWVKVSGKWYYFESSGAMRTANLKYKGKTYRFNSSGACLNP